MTIKTFLLGCFLMAFIQPTMAQHTPHPSLCATQDGKVDWLLRYQQNPAEFSRSAVDLFVPIKIHIVGNSDGEGYFGVGNVLEAFCTLNRDFEPYDMQFFISGDFNYIDNDNYFVHTFQQGFQMMNNNNFQDVINCYIVSDPAGACGYSNYSRGIALNKSCIGPADHTWAHEIGHYLSLPHTFFGWEGTDLNGYDYSTPAPNSIGGETVERMDGSNCHFAADGFCDTPPDYLADRWGCTNDALSSVVQTDPDTIDFRSDATFFMSYALDNCTNRFSAEQVDAMFANVENERSYLLDQMDPLQPVGEAILNPVAPAEGATVDFFETVAFEWEAIDHADGYIIDVSRVSNFAFVEKRYHVQGTSFISNDLKSDKIYYWRIWPYNAQYTCETYSEVASFSTGILSGVDAIDEVNGLAVSPNPIGQGRQLQLNLDLDASLVLEVDLLNLTGQSVQQFSWNANSGENQRTIETAALNPGIYFVRLQSAEGTLSKRIVVQ